MSSPLPKPADDPEPDHPRREEEEKPDALIGTIAQGPIAPDVEAAPGGEEAEMVEPGMKGWVSLLGVSTESAWCDGFGLMLM